jgi:hypothetical protein
MRWTALQPAGAVSYRRDGGEEHGSSGDDRVRHREVGVTGSRGRRERGGDRPAAGSDGRNSWRSSPSCRPAYAASKLAPPRTITLAQQRRSGLGIRGPAQTSGLVFLRNRGVPGPDWSMCWRESLGVIGLQVGPIPLCCPAVNPAAGESLRQPGSFAVALRRQRLEAQRRSAFHDQP